MREVKSQKSKVKGQKSEVGDHIPPIAYRLSPIVLSLLIFCSCKLRNELYDNTDQPKGNGAGNLPRVIATNPLLADIALDDDTLADGIQSTVSITFDDYMDPSAMTAQNVTVQNTSAGTPVGGLTFTYGPGARTLYIRGENWQQNSSFLVTLAADAVRNLQGSPLDGNGNQRLDSASADNFLTTFYTSGSGSANCVPTVPPRIAFIAPDTGRIDTALPELRVGFTQTMDTATLKDPNNLKLTTSSGTTLALALVQVNGLTIVARPANPLPKGQVYYVTLACNSIRSNPPPNTPSFLRTLDGDGNGPGGIEPDYRWYFLCDTLEPPSVDSAVWFDGHIQVDFLQLMDTASLGSGATRVYDEQGFVPGDIRCSVTFEGVTRLDYYFQRPVSYPVRVFVSHLAKSVNGAMLDGNNNGVGGETTDDYRIELTP
jgi:hypothetical protein